MQKVRGRRYRGGRHGMGGPTYAIDNAENIRSTLPMCRHGTAVDAAAVDAENMRLTPV